MDISAKVLREFEFRTGLRGYDTDEVDEFLEKVAVAVDELQNRLRDALDRAQRAEDERGRQPEARTSDADPDAISRALLLAQRAADMAVREAEEQAEGILAAAREQSDGLVTAAHEMAERSRNEAERDLAERVEALGHDRKQLEEDVASLSSLLERERERLVGGLRVAIRQIERGLASSTELSDRQRETSETQMGEDRLESQIAEDAATARGASPNGGDAHPTVRGNASSRVVFAEPEPDQEEGEDDSEDGVWRLDWQPGGSSA